MPARLLFQDEARFGRLSDHRRCWAPWPCRPSVGQQVIREYLYGVVAVSPSDGKLSSLVLPWVDAQAMSVFLTQVCLDFPALRVPSHLQLLSLPPYSPELNPVEHLWEHLRENYFGNQVFPSLKAVEDRLCLGLSNLEQQPEIVKSITCFDWIKPLCLTLN